MERLDLDLNEIDWIGSLRKSGRKLEKLEELKDYLDKGGPGSGRKKGIKSKYNIPKPSKIDRTGWKPASSIDWDRIYGKKKSDGGGDMDAVEEQVKEPFAVATAVAQEMGYSDFAEGSPGRKKRDEIAEALKNVEKGELAKFEKWLKKRRYAAQEG